MAAVTSLAVLAVVLAVIATVLLTLAFQPTPSPEDRVRDDLAQALIETQAVLRRAHVQFDEAAGYRQPNEARLGDDLRGAWQTW